MVSRFREFLLHLMLHPLLQHNLDESKRLPNDRSNIPNFRKKIFALCEDFFGDANLKSLMRMRCELAIDYNSKALQFLSTTYTQHKYGTQAA
jgi:hypothetical protein